MTARKHQALGKGLGALFPSELKTPEIQEEEVVPVVDTNEKIEITQETEEITKDHPREETGILAKEKIL